MQRNQKPRRLPALLFISTILLLGLVGCPPAALSQGPSGPGWTTYNQGCNKRSASSGSDYSSYSSEQVWYDGSYLHSREKPWCEGVAWVEDYDFERQTRAEGKRHE